MYINKLPQAKVINLKDEVKIAPNQVSSMSLVQKNDLNLTVFALDKDQKIGGHSSKGDAMVNILSGVAKITIEETEYLVSAGESIILPANVKHALYAVEAFQMLLIVVKP